MRVLMLNYEYPPLGGGAAQANRNILAAMAAMPDLAIDLVTASTGAERSEATAPGQTIHFLDIGKGGSLQYQSNRDLLAYSYRALAFARRLAARERYDLCHAFFGIPCGALAGRLGLPYVVSLRGSDVPFYNPRFRLADALLFQRLSRRVWRRAAAVVANSEGLRELALQSAPGQAIEVIPNGVDTARFHPAAEGARTGTLRVLVVARLIARKGIEHLIDGVRHLNGAPVRLTIAGDGNQRALLEARAADLGETVRFLGAVPHESLPALYRDHDVFVLPSLNEGMSNTVLEALASGLPVLMTRTGGARELVTPGENGAYIEASGASIAQALRGYLNDPARLAREGSRARRRAEGQGWRAVAEAYAECYHRVRDGAR